MQMPVYDSRFYCKYVNFFPKGNGYTHWYGNWQGCGYCDAYGMGYGYGRAGGNGNGDGFGIKLYPIHQMSK